ncbi:MAG: NUDIX hydrolase [Caldilineaceae bacterium]
MTDERHTPPPVFPRKRVAAGALFLDETGNILLVNPTYKPPWEIPGGMVEADEAPLTACRREVAEEIGLTVTPDTLLSVGYLRSYNNRGDSIRFIFWGGVLDGPMIAKIILQKSELSEYRFVSLQEAAHLVRPSMHAQLGQSLETLAALAAGKTSNNYWEEC